MVAQILLGIQVRLFSLDSGPAGRAPDLGRRITEAQRLVTASVRSIQEFARNLKGPAQDYAGRMQGGADRERRETCLRARTVRAAAGTVDASARRSILPRSRIQYVW